jgi:pimeloyl-ACP methyl ester carboxylesterase
VSGPFRPPSGVTTYVEDTGGSGPAILAVHGLGGGAWFFAGFARRMAPRYRILSVDLPGTGRSLDSPHRALSIDSWVTDLGALAAERCQAPVVFLGHSLGTILALEAARTWPIDIRALVLVGGLPEPRPLIRERLLARADAVDREGLAGMGAVAAAANLSRRTLEGQPEMAGLFERLFELQDARIYAEWCRVLAGASAERAVGGVRVPCLSIVGAEDQYAPPGLVSAFMDRVPGSAGVHVMADCAHLPFLEQPQAFAGAVSDFVEGLC